MEQARRFFDGVSVAMMSPKTIFALVVIIFLIGCYLWYCQVFGSQFDPESKCQTYNRMAIWMNFLAILMMVYIMGRQKLYPETVGFGNYM